MPKTTIGLGSLVLICLLWVKVGAYFDGLNYSYSWFYPMVLVPVIFISAIGFIGAFIATLVSVMRKKSNYGQLLVAAVLPFLAFTIPALPLPSFTDGLRSSLENQLDRRKLIEFANQAKRIADIKNQEFSKVTISGLSWDYAESSDKYEMLKDIYPEALEMSHMPARVTVSIDEVVILYGGALTTHYGYAIVDDDNCPIDRLPASRCQRVFEKIWVYDDIY